MFSEPPARKTKKESRERGAQGFGLPPKGKQSQERQEFPTKYKRILARAVRLADLRQLSYAAVRLLKEILFYSQGRYKACIACNRLLSQKIKRSIRHTRRLLRQLEITGLIRRISRFFRDTKGHISNQIQILNSPLPEIPWENPSLEIQTPENSISDLEMRDYLKSIFAGFTSEKEGILRGYLRKFFNNIKNSQTFNQFVRYFLKKRADAGKPIISQKAYINATVRNFSQANSDFWAEFIDYLEKKINAFQPSPEPAKTEPEKATEDELPPQPKDLKPLEEINPDLARQITDFMRRKELKNKTV